MASLSSCFDTILVNKYWESVKTVILLIHLMTECICGKDLWQFSNEWGTILKYFKKLEKKFKKKKKFKTWYCVEDMLIIKLQTLICVIHAKLQNFYLRSTYK